VNLNNNIRFNKRIICTLLGVFTIGFLLVLAGCSNINEKSQDNSSAIKQAQTTKGNTGEANLKEDAKKQEETKAAIKEGAPRTLIKWLRVDFKALGYKTLNQA
jgi:hypothetical protein